MVAWGILVGVLGAVMGILMCKDRLRMGCPRCGAKADVPDGNSEGLRMVCGTCGELRVKAGSLFGLKVVRVGSEKASPQERDSRSLLLLPRDRPIAFALLYLPVMASVIAAAALHEFSAFYLLIPGFWCYWTGCLLIDGIDQGRFGDNCGTAVRAEEPVRFWAKLGIWALAYCVAAAFPVLAALEERAESRAEPVPTPAAAPPLLDR